MVFNFDDSQIAENIVVITIIKLTEHSVQFLFYQTQRLNVIRSLGHVYGFNT